MLRSVIAGSGSAIAPHRVTNDMLARIMDTSDAWIRERTGVETRYYVEPGTRTTDLGVIAAERALEMAGVAREDIDLVVFATMTPDQYFPGCGGLLQSRLGLRPVPAFDIRQQCSGFLYGLQLVDAHIRAGLARTALLVGAEIHSGFMPWGPGSWARLAGDVEAPLEPGEWETTTSVRHLTVLFGDAGGAVVITAADDGSRGVVDQALYADGTDAAKLCVPGNGFARRPYVDPEQIRRLEHVPVMDGRYVFKMATTRMTEAARALLERNGLTPGDLKLVLMHQANLRINEAAQKQLGLPDDKVFNNIDRWGNTTSATLPLAFHEARAAGKAPPGSLVAFAALGAGLHWGAVLLRV